MKRLIAVSLAIGASTSFGAGMANGAGNMKIRMTVGPATLEATLHDNPTARDFFSMLPLTVPLEDYAATEKIGYLPRKLSTAGAPKASKPSVGDIGYYAPWGNLALYHRDFDDSPGLVLLGRIDAGIDVLKMPGKRSATIEAVSSK